MADLKQECAERELAREFLESFMELKVLSCTSGDKPDVTACVLVDGKSRCLGIEVTKYHVDAPPSNPHGSPGQRLQDTWDAIEGEIRRRMTNAPELAYTYGILKLKKLDNPPKLGMASQFAEQLVLFALANPVSPGQDIRHESFSRSFPFLHDHVQFLILKGTRFPFLDSWHCTDVNITGVATRLDYIAEIISGKKVKAQGYDRKKFDELRLLIVAPGYPIICTAGPAPMSLDWNTCEMRAALADNLFDRVYFWERAYSWCKPIYPEGDMIHKGLTIP